MQHSTKPFPVASCYDTAIDVSAMGEDVVKYYKERDPKLVKSKPGKRVTWFYLRRIRTSVFETYVMSGANENEQYRRAFEVGVECIENFTKRDGTFVARFEPTGKTGNAPGTEMSFFREEEMEEVWPAYKQEIGAVAWARSFLDPGKGLSLPELPTLQRALSRRIVRDAESHLKAAAQNKGDSAGKSTKTHAEDGGEDTAAPATASQTKSSGTSGTSTSAASSKRSKGSRAKSKAPARGKRSRTR